MDKQEVLLNARFYDATDGVSVAEPPLHPNAVLGGSYFLPYGELIEMVRARYNGPAIVVCAGEHELTIGPNHPIQTTRGMVRATDLHEGDEILYDLRVNASHACKPNLIQMPPVEDAFEALCADGSYAGIVAAGHNLHGDAQWCHGEIEVVRPVRPLLPVLDPDGIKRLCKRHLVAAYAELAVESRASSHLFGGDGITLAASRFVSGPDPWVLADHFVWLPVQNIVRTKYQGWAFDASTASLLYCSDGFVVSNCRCAMRLVFLDAP